MKDIKFVIIGESRIGKTCLINQYVNSFFDPLCYITTGKDISYKELKINENTLNLEIWDIAGIGLYRTVNKIFLKNTQIALLVYDITDQNSFNQLNYWINEIKDLNDKNIILGIAANKIDLFDKKVVSNEEGEKFAKDNNLEFFETSAYNYESIEKVFNRLGEIYLEKLKEEEEKKNNDIQTNDILNSNISLGEYKKIKYKNGDEYEGYLNNNIKEGRGKLKIKNGVEYKGLWSNDNFIKGNIKYKNGEIYDGDCIDYKRDGEGKMIYNNGNVYNGDWKNDKINGKGTMKYYNNDEYNGNWINDKKEGDGEMIYNNGDKYNGNWINDKRNGIGNLTYKNGNIYIGNWSNDIKKGKGQLEFKEGYYEGEWENDELNGNGKIYYKSGKIFEGFFINGKREGNGKIINENICYLNLKFENDISNEEGEFIFNNGRVINGFYDNIYNLTKGILKFPNGDIYEGEFDKNGNMKGKGIMKYNNGVIYNGEWDNDNKNGEGLLYINEEDYQIINNNFIIDKIFSLKLKSYYIYKGTFINNFKEGNGKLFLNNNDNFFENNTFFIGEFKDNKKLNGCLYFNNGSNFICNWKDDNNIDETKLGIFNLNHSIKIEKELNTEKWIKLIRKEQLNYYGIQNKNAPIDIMIR